ncbi:thiamine biosynthesis lipoprotein [Anaerobacterium chartisolvens]|uniref:FAD:protein FMN transferase n=1 Tax=Anaerobacterium chartisolvens TaxID=1297424 RepID=A0A369ASC5_9FIRM|nr:FAD:protein FMN transferase [Anaerobacterium chartisolvens]RCX11166.1 thiamine biosynthesis lipoprotein [Anaerobacterium chartisolvens]
MKKIAVAAIVIAVLIFGAFWLKSDKHFEQQSFLMGTVISEKVYGYNARKASAEAMARIGEIENTMTVNAQGSQAEALNEASGKKSIRLDGDIIEVLETAKKYSSISGGAFDVTVGPLVKAWGISTEHFKIPEKEEIDELLSLVNYNDIYIDSNNGTVRLAREGQAVDLGAIAKGYAADQTIEIYKRWGIKSAYINLGGNVSVLGKKPDGTLWRIGIQNPRAANGKIVGVINIQDKSVVTSGDYERFSEKDNVRYHHILDPHTGYPSGSGLMGATILADSSVAADALSTAVFVLGLEKGIELVESLEGVEAVFITEDKRIYTTSGLKDEFIFDDESKEFQYVQKR